MEASQIKIEDLKNKARDHRAKTRRELGASIVMALIVLAIAGFGILHTHSLGVQMVFGLAVVWALAGQYLLHRGMWLATPPGDAALSSGLQFYRQEVEQRLFVFRRVLQWSFGPVVLSIATLILVLVGIAENQSRSVEKVIPFCTVFAIWIGAFFVLRSRSQRRLRQEIDELNDIERASNR